MHTVLRSIRRTHGGIRPCLWSRLQSTSSTTKTPTTPLPIPSIPPRPEEPTPYVTTAQIREYIAPLYTRFWAVNYFHREILLREGELVEESFVAPGLNRAFTFRDFAAASNFLKDVEDIAGKEQHIPSITVRGSRLVSGTPHVEIASWTAQTVDAPSLLTPGESRIGPGITLKDARLAILLEKKFDESYLTNDIGVPSTKRPSRHTREPSTLEAITARQRKLDGVVLKREASQKLVVAEPKVGRHPIPNAPAASEGMCGDEEFANVLVPLFSRGWSVWYKGGTFHEGENVIASQVASLVGFFRFKSFDDCVALAQEILALAQKENVHDAVISIDANTVTVERLLRRTAEQDIPINDARFAVLVEQLVSDKYHHKLRDSNVYSIQRRAYPSSVEELKMHQFGRKSSRIRARAKDANASNAVRAAAA
ncbi:hypothetical protein BDQ12DRAFT_683925 [Crucibulum laeve]|uniref:Uncharacterized protein n=1 Tax=Crucibulum laeve TaxID=68775 RepID=A0A5C3LY71_9AGAR|nr:hypothetical protein BDQ12DRAFT_683925 [Crucibulum laeve]